MILYIVLRDGKPLINNDISNDFDEEYKSSGDELVRLVRDEAIGIWHLKTDADLYAEFLQNVFPDADISVGELHLIMSTTEWS